MSNNRVHDGPPPFYNWQVFSISLSHTITYIYLFASPTAFTPNSEQVWQAWVYLIHCALASARLLRRNILSPAYMNQSVMHMTGWLRSSALSYWRHRQSMLKQCWNSVETVQVSWSCIQITAMIFRLCSSYSLAARGALSRQFHGNTIIRESVKDKVREMGQKVRLRYYSCCCTTSWHFTRSISKWVKAWLQLSTKEKRQPTQQKRN